MPTSRAHSADAVARTHAAVVALSVASVDAMGPARLPDTLEA
jgi:hypothetical protein